MGQYVEEEEGLLSPHGTSWLAPLASPLKCGWSAGIMREASKREIAACLQEFMQLVARKKQLPLTVDVPTRSYCPSLNGLFTVLTEGKGWVELNPGQWVSQSVQSPVD